MGIVNANKVRYLEPLLSFLGKDKPLDIFSVNYDMAIEQFCNIYKIEYTDGFDLYWNQKNFDRTDVDIRLYKIHGSILWYKTDRGYYVKLPTKIEGPHTELITGEKAVSLMLYPMRKWDYDEPLLEMLLKMKERMEKTHFVVVVGYSFRDDHIRRIFWDAARTNKKLILILISPNAPEIYENKLRDYEIPELKHTFSSAFNPASFDACFPSALAGRVVYLPYKFEDILPFLNSYLMQLTYAMGSEKAEKEREYKGEPTQTFWSWILKNYLGCEYVDKINEISSKVDWSKEPFENAFVIHFNAVLSYIAVGSKPNLSDWAKKLDVHLRKFSVDKLSIEISSPPLTKYRMVFKDADGSSISLPTLTQSLKYILDIAKRKSLVAQDNRADQISEIKTKLEQFYDHLSPLQNDFSLVDYEKLNKSVLPENWLWVKTNNISPDKGQPERTATEEEIKNKILENEQKQLEKIFGGSKLTINAT